MMITIDKAALVNKALQGLVGVVAVEMTEQAIKKGKELDVKKVDISKKIKMKKRKAKKKEKKTKWVEVEA